MDWLRYKTSANVLLGQFVDVVITEVMRNSLRGRLVTA